MTQPVPAFDPRAFDARAFYAPPGDPVAKPGRIVVRAHIAATIEVTIDVAGLTCTVSAPSVTVSALPVDCS